MKVTVITGSAHRHGTSAHLADKFIEGATVAGHEVFRFDAAFQQVHGCLGCDACRKGGGCVYRDDMQTLNPHLLDCDAVVFASPVYYFNINAQIKAVIDRFYANNAALQGHKRAALLVTMADDCLDSAEGPEAFFRQFTRYMRWENLGVVAAINSATPADLARTDYPRQAYELGRSL